MKMANMIFMNKKAMTMQELVKYLIWIAFIVIALGAVLLIKNYL